MVAIHIPSPAHDDWRPAPRQPGSPRTAERPVPGGDGGAVTRPRSLPDRATRLRRRRLALLVAVVVVAIAGVLAAQAIAGLARVDGSSRPEPVDAGPAPVAGQTYVVQGGDTLWSIATEVAPDRDPRQVVDALRSANGGSATLQPGTRLEVEID
jgi:hypothetical protein